MSASTVPLSPPRKTEPPPLIEPLLTKTQAAKLLGCCARTIDNLHAVGKLPFVKIGTRALVDPADLRRLIDGAKT